MLTVFLENQALDIHCPRTWSSREAVFTMRRNYLLGKLSGNELWSFQLGKTVMSCNPQLCTYVESVAVVVGDLDTLDIGTGLGWGTKEGFWPVRVVSMLSSDEILLKYPMTQVILIFVCFRKCEDRVEFCGCSRSEVTGKLWTFVAPTQVKYT